MILGYFDIIILLGLVFINYKIATGQILSRMSILESTLIIPTLFIVFGIALPLISLIAEVQIYSFLSKVSPDSYELFYVFFRFPTYWILGVIQLILFVIWQSK